MVITNNLPVNEVAGQLEGNRKASWREKQNTSNQMWKRALLVMGLLSAA
jgi:hypothetical protein